MSELLLRSGWCFLFFFLFLVLGTELRVFAPSYSPSSVSFLILYDNLAEILNCSDCTQICNPSASASPSGRFTGMHHHARHCFPSLDSLTSNNCVVGNPGFEESPSLSLVTCYTHWTNINFQKCTQFQRKTPFLNDN